MGVETINAWLPQTLAGIWTFLTTGWDAAKTISAIAALVTITSTGFGLYLKYRTSGRQLVKRMLEFIKANDKRLADTRTTLGTTAHLPSPSRDTAEPVFPRHVLEPKLKKLKWGRSQKASKALAKAITAADERATVANLRAQSQRREQALAHLMLGAVHASHQSDDTGELAEARALALAEFDKALAIDPEDRDAIQYAGMMLLQMANARGALDRFNTLVNLAKVDADKLRLARAYRLQATAYASLPSPEWMNANGALITALNEYPQTTPPLEHAEAHEQHGDVRTSWQRFGVANTSYQAALTIYYANRSVPAAAEGITRVSGKLAKLNTAPTTQQDGNGTLPPVPPSANGSNYSAQVTLKLPDQ